MSKKTALSLAILAGTSVAITLCFLVAIIAMWINAPQLAGLGGVVCGMFGYYIGTLVYDRLY